MHIVTQPISNAQWFSERMLYYEDVFQKVENKRLCRIYDAGLALTATSLRYLEIYIRGNEEKHVIFQMMI